MAMKHLWLLFSCCFYCLFLSAQLTTFKQLIPEAGPSPGHVNDFLKTSDGFLWTASQDGLYRYDGYNMTVFRPNNRDSNSLSNAFIWTMLEASNNQLWLGTYGSGLACYDRAKEKFHTYPLPTGSAGRQSVKVIRENKAGELLLGTENGLWIFQPKSQDFLAVTAASNDLKLSIVYDIHPLDDNENHYLIAATEGLFVYSPEKGLLPSSLQGRGVTAIVAKDQQLWVGGFDGLYQVQFDTSPSFLDIIQHYEFASNQNSPLAAAINCLLLDLDGMLWIGSFNGLYQLNTQAKGAIPIALSSLPGQQLPDLQINSIFQVEPGLIWIATRQGISYRSNAPVVFHHLNQAAIGNALCSDVILGSIEDEEGNWWLGTKEGLTKIDCQYDDNSPIPHIKSINCFSPGNMSGMPEAYVINSRKTGGEQWFTFWRGGLGKLNTDSKSPKLEGIPGLNKLTNNAGIHDILTDSRGNSWIATPNRGIIQWDREADTLVIHEPQTDQAGGLVSPYIFYLLEDAQNRIWAGTANGGLCVKAPDTDVFDCYLQDATADSSLSNNMVLSVFEDSKQRIWACTAGGLNLWLGDNRFQSFTSQDGLPSEVVYGMLEDDEGQLWLSTNNGLVCMKEKDGRWAFQVFVEEDGLQANEFNQYAFFKTARGLLCFGGPNGLTYFDPRQIKPYSHQPMVAITDFQLFNRSQEVGDILDKSINETAYLELSYQQNYLAFEFAALGYSQAEQNTYAYQMTGVDQDWVYSGQRRYVSYPKLAPGNYTFSVKAANHDHIWSTNIKTLNIHICPPWWHRWWAYALYAIGTLLLLWAILNARIQRVRRLEQARQSEREAFRKKTARDFHDEAGNQITKMSLLTAVMKRTTRHETELSPMLEQLEQNIQSLRTGMRDFIWVLDPQNDNLYDLMLRLKLFGQDLFEHAQANFTFPDMQENWRQLSLNSPTRRHLLLIFKEAMHNSIKHADASLVQFELELRAKQLQMKLQDNGTGLGSELPATQGSGLRNMHQRAKTIGGILHISKHNAGGTEVSLTIEITQMED